MLCCLSLYILRTGTGRTDGCDVYRVASRVLLTDVPGEGTQLSQVMYGDLLSQRRGWRVVLLTLFQRFVRQGRVT